MQQLGFRDGETRSPTRRATGTATDPKGRDLLERGDELRLIDDTIEASVVGAGALLLITGAAGTGKSALLDVADSRASTRGLRVLRARCSELELAFSFGAALQLLEPAVADLTPAVRQRMFLGTAGQAEGLLSGRVDPASHPGPVQSLFPLIHGLFWVLVSLADDSPVAVLVDDAQWCDDASLRFLAHLARRLEGMPLAVVLAVREETPTPVSPALEELYSDRRAVRASVGSLSEEGVGNLVRRSLSPAATPEFCASCAHATGGNPFLLRELMTELSGAGFTGTSAEAARVDRLVPPSVLRAVMARTARLPEGSVELARAAAVLGRQATLRRCAFVGGLELDTALLATEALVAAGLFDDREETTFSHPLIRTSVQRDIAHVIEGRLHLRAARVLQDQGEPVEIVAAHLMESGGTDGERWIVDVLRSAAERALAAADPGKAVSLLERARDGAPVDVRGSLLAELGQAQALAAHPDALATLEEAVEQAVDPVERTAILRRKGDLLFARNQPHDALVEYDRALAGADPSSPEARDLGAARSVVVAVFPGGLEETLANVGSILARQGPDTRAELGLLAQVALRMALTGEPCEQTRDLAMRAWADGALLDHEGPDGHMWSMVSGALSFSGYCAESIGILDRVIEASQRVGSVLAFASASYSRSGPLYWSGRVVQAAADAQRALDAQEDGWCAWVGSASSLLARCLVDLGQIEHAGEVLGDVDDPRWAASIEGLTVLDARAYVNLGLGRHEQALADYLLLGDRCETAFGVRSPVIMPWHGGAALACLRLGDVEQASKLNSSGLELARRFGAPGPLGRSMIIGGMISMAIGSTEEGLDAISDGIDVLAGSDAHLEYAFGLVEMGTALRRINRRTEARAPLMAACDVAGSLGAAALEDRAMSELLATGARPRRKAVTGVEALTPSESRIAEFVCQGLTNRQVAERLFITPKAVEFHLANTYRKLQIRGRADLAKALRG